MPVAPARILLLEDDPADRKYMNACLADGGLNRVELHHAAKLVEASAYLKAQDCELVITDLNLPDTEGMETFYKVKELAKDAAIVVMTGLDDFNLASRAMRAGAQDYLVKGDLAPQRVCQSVSKALERHAQLKNLVTETLDLRKKNISLRELVHIDPLTGLFNRRGFQKALARPSQSPEFFQSSCALMVGLDDFKKINDLCGYDCGNDVLREVGRRIRHCLKPGDVAARIGGDEFLIFLPGTTPGVAKDLGEQIRRAVATARLPGEVKMTASVGVTALPKRACTMDEVLGRSHRVLRMSKLGGKNQVALGGELPELGAGLGSPAPTLSPFFCLRSGRLAGYDISYPEGVGEGFAAASGEVDPLVEALLHSAAERGAGLECHVRLSHSQLLRLRPEQLVAHVQPDADGRKLRLSIPEIPMSPVPPGILEAIRYLQEMGWVFAMHGLDLGPYNWASLILLEPAVVVLKPDLVTGAWADHRRLRSLVRLSRAVNTLGAYMVAGGIETTEDLKVLQVLGVPYGWGPLMVGDLPRAGSMVEGPQATV